MVNEEKKTVSIVVLSHGKFAEGILDTVSILFGDSAKENFYTVCLGPDDDMNSYAVKVAEVLDKNEDNLVFVDLYGGTPFNAIVKLSKDRKINAIAGVNVPVLLEALASRTYFSSDVILNNLENIWKDSIVNITKVIEEGKNK